MTDYDPFNKPPRKRSGRGGNYVDPPAQHRFKPGQSGNPRGRPKGSISLPNAMVKLLRKKTKVTIGGEVRNLTQSDIIAIQIIQHAAKGDLNFIKFVSQQTQNHPEMQLQTAADVTEKEVLIDEVMGLMKALIQSQTQDIQPNPIKLPGDMAEATGSLGDGMVVPKAGSPLPAPATTPASIRPPAPKPQPTEEELREKRRDEEMLHCISRSKNPEKLLKLYEAEKEARKRKSEG